MSSKTMFVFSAQDGSQWAFAGEVVAANRATYYAKDDPDTTYQAEFDYALNDKYELHDWLGNNMNFEDFAKYVRPYKPAPPINLEKAWQSEESTCTQMDVPAHMMDLPLPPSCDKA